ncbi:hypothetical protein L6164_009199 [Bauhinia variegata]|uniref:Uncharacterized protein n=1 Tax=Bauhinia variegata TaxID=167791 RepID=A0ACB9PIW5_BAUVA|nr:hypothetical protein L6164_009199 [Bauhinia variegata]
MASLILLFSELVRHHDLDLEALISTYPTSSCAAAAAAAKGSSTATNSLRNQSSKKSTQEAPPAMENPLESRVSVDLVWP